MESEFLNTVDIRLKMLIVTLPPSSLVIFSADSFNFLLLKMFLKNDLWVIASNLRQPKAAWMTLQVKIHCNQKAN